MSLVILTVATALAGGLARESHREAQARFGYAVLLARRDLPARALGQLEVAARLDPDALEVARDKLRLYALLGRHPAAIRTAREVLARDPDDVATAQALAQLLHDGKNPAAAVKVLQAALKSSRLATSPLSRYGVLRDLLVAAEAAKDDATREAALAALIALSVGERGALVGSPWFETPEALARDVARREEQRGDALLALKRLPEAEAAYRRAGGPRLGWNLSGVALAQGRFPEALALLLPFLPSSPPPQAVHYERLADLARRVNRPEEVVPRLRRLAEDRPDAAPVRWVLAAELQRGDPPAAARLFRELADASVDPEFFRRLVAYHRESGRVRELLDLVDLYALATQAEPDAPANGKGDGLARFRALVQAMKADPALGLAVLRQPPAELTARHKFTRELVLWFAGRERRYDAIEPALLALVDADFPMPRPRGRAEPEAPAVELLLECLARQRKWGDCLELCDKLEGRAGRNGRINWKYRRVGPLMELGRGPEALRTLDEAARLADRPDNVELRKASVLSLLDRHAEALAVVEAVLRKNPEAEVVHEARLHQAVAYNGLRQPAKADAVYEALLEQDPDDALVLNNFAYNLADQGRRLPEAEAMVRRAVEIDEDAWRREGRPDGARGTYLDSLGWVLFRRGRLAEARATFAEAMLTADGAADAVVWDHAGDVEARLNDPAKARDFWTQAEKLYEHTHQGRQHGRRDEVRVKLQQLP